MPDPRPASAPGASTLQPGIPGFSYHDFFAPAALARLLRVFVDELEHRDPAIGLRYREILERGDPSREEESWLCAEVGPVLGRFVARLFGAEAEVEEVRDSTRVLDAIFEVRREFLRRRVAKRVPESVAAGLSEAAVAELQAAAAKIADEVGRPRAGEHPEVPLARAILRLLEAEKTAARGGPTDPGLATPGLLALGGGAAGSALPAVLLDLLSRFCAAVRHRPEFAGHRRSWVLFREQHALDFQALVPREFPRPDLPGYFEGPREARRSRDGFALTDPRMDLRHALGEIDTCIFCHHQGRDTCAKGHLDRSGAVKKNPLGIALEGCPLDEHISEAHELRQRGEAVAALAAVMINNPMCPGTGHRICNDCMKACIFQKQDPVNIPEIETRILTDVLGLPYGPEIYGLLTRWNPLNVRRPYQLPLNGKKVLVVGLGPAGYTLAHYLANEGFGVVAIDGLKLEPLPGSLVGPGFAPIRDWPDFVQPLDRRSLDGFGGVSEYGITVRWDKNFLRLLYVTLSRKAGFAAFGGVRFGGTLTLEDAAELGFDHVAVATGAGRPTVVDMKNNLIRGVRQASDFLMALQLTGAAKEDSLANLQVSLPAVVVGGGLTAIDTATELLAYYPVQVERVLARTERLAAMGRLDAFLARLSAEERELLDEFLEHGRAVRAEREAARREGRTADLSGLARRFGGVTIAYRKTLQESPAYRLNHEEVIKALEEGIGFLEEVSPTEAVPDAHGRIASLRFSRADGTPLEIPCRALLIAAGTSPNTIYEREHEGTFVLEGRFFKPYEARREAGEVKLEPASDARQAFFTSYERNGLTVSYFGDNHPAYAGNVVKAMASARAGFPHIARLLRPSFLDPTGQPVRDRSFQELVARLREELTARVELVQRLTPTIVEVVLKAPRQARRFEPGQFYRLQDFESQAPVVDGIRLAMEGIALTGAWVDRERGLLSLIILEMGGSSNLCAQLRPGQEVVCMGPTGEPTWIPRGENVVLAGGGLGNAVLFSIARALRAAGSRVLYFAGYKAGEDLFKQEEIEAATDQVVYSTEGGAEIRLRRPQDRHFRGNIVQAMCAYARGGLGPAIFPLASATRIIAIGSDRMMAAVKAARHDPGLLAPHLGPHAAIGSINSPMQCMMKEVCAQCLQRHVDPVTGRESFVFSCFNQDQELDRVDFGHLNLRLRQNSLLEKLSAGIIAGLLPRLGARAG
jgi:NADPH-dependent glutamate synthase beta subunit-like oxidoreductase/NAD(P)H-flavin reductase